MTEEKNTPMSTRASSRTEKKTVTESLILMACAFTRASGRTISNTARAPSILLMARNVMKASISAEKFTAGA